MNEWLRFNSRLADAGLAALRAGADAATTIAARSLMLATAVTPSDRMRAAREIERMVTEKADAATRGALAGARQFAAMASTAGNPVAAAHGMLGIIEATSAPVYARVGANARRLAPRSRRSGQ